MERPIRWRRRPDRRPLILGVLLLVGCVGPRYVRPSVQTPPAFKPVAARASGSAVGSIWQPAQPQDTALKGAWWELFSEPELNALEQQLNEHNQTIAQYYQNYMAARALIAVARASYFPTLTVNPEVTRAKQSARAGSGALLLGSGGTAVSNGGSSSAVGSSPGAGSSAGASGISATGAGGSTFTDFSLPFEASWEPDLWGRVRNTVREYRYAAQASAADLQNERLAAQAALAQYYFQLRGQDSLQDLYDRTIAADRESLRLTQALFRTGIDSEEDVAQAQVTLDNAEAAAVGIATNRALYEHAIATLVGQPAASFTLPSEVLATAVPQFPIGVPSLLLQRRPDIAAAERTMAQANAAIGVQTSAYYPNLSLSAQAGFQSTALSTLLSAPARFWSLGAQAAELLFDAGQRHATIRQYTALYNADVAAYRQTVLTAFQQVEDELSTLGTTSEQMQRQQAAVASAQHYLDIATVRYRTGIDPYLNVMTAELTLLSDQQTEASLRVNELVAAVQLIEALGGGWDARAIATAAE